MVETHYRPEERGPDEPDPDDPGLFIAGETEGLPVVDRQGLLIGSLTEGYVFGGSVDRVIIHVDEAVQREHNLPEVLDLESEWLNRRENDIQLVLTLDQALDELGFD